MTFVSTLPWTFAISLKFSLSPLFEDLGLPLALMGIFIVFVALVLVVMFISALPRFMQILEVYLPSGDQAALLAASSPRQEETEESIVAVIAAAVAATLDQDHRIIRMREITAHDMAWSQQGRLQIQTSHKPHK